MKGSHQIGAILLCLCFLTASFFIPPMPMISSRNDTSEIRFQGADEKPYKSDEKYPISPAELAKDIQNLARNDPTPPGPIFVQITSTGSANPPHFIRSTSGRFYMVYAYGGDVLITNSSNGLSWSSPIYIETGGTYSMHGSDICQTSDGMFYVVMRRNTGGGFYEDIYITNSSDGITWETPAPLVTTSTYDTFPRITKGLDDSLWVLYSHSVTASTSGDWDLYVLNSTDGVNWSSPRQITDETFQERWGDILVASDGSVHVSYQKYQSGTFWVFETHSDDGIIWSEGVEVVSSSYVPTHGGSLTQTNDGRFLLTFDANSDSNLYMLKSKDGIVWTPPEIIAQSVMTQEYPDIFAEGNTLHLVFRTGGNAYYGRDSITPLISLEWQYDTGAGIRGSPTIADIDHDGQYEVLMVSDTGNLNCVNTTGDLEWSYPAGGNLHTTPAVADIDADGYLEVAFGSWNGWLFCINGSGDLEWSYNTGDTIYSSSACIADVDHDNDLEILIGSRDNRIHCLNYSGYVEWTFLTGGDVDSSPAAADVDGDGRVEIVTGSDDHYLYCLNGSTGAQEWRYPVGGGMLMHSEPIVADVDLDDEPEIIVGSDSGIVYCFNGTGTVEWSYTTGADIDSSPTVADVDQDGKMEVLIGSDTNYLYCLNDTGDLEWSYLTGGDVYTSPCVTDIDGDGQLDILFGSASDNKIHWLNSTGHLVWEYVLGSVSWPVVFDIDRDGHQEILAGSSYYLYCFEVFWIDIAEYRWPSICYRADLNHTANYVDSDNDHLPDGYEICAGTNPYTNDTDYDLFTDFEEFTFVTNPAESLVNVFFDDFEDGNADNWYAWKSQCTAEWSVATIAGRKWVHHSYTGSTTGHTDGNFLVSEFCTIDLSKDFTIECLARYSHPSMWFGMGISFANDTFLLNFPRIGTLDNIFQLFDFEEKIRAPVVVIQDTNYYIKLVKIGSNIKGYVNDSLILEANRACTGIGQLAVNSRGDYGHAAEASYDWVRAYGPGITNLAGPWCDNDDDGIPNYLDTSIFDVIILDGPVEAYDLTWNPTAYTVLPSISPNKMLNYFHYWGINDLGIYSTVIALVFEIGHPFADAEEIANWLDDLGLMEVGGKENAENLLTEILCSDGKIRVMTLFLFNSETDWQLLNYLLDDSIPIPPQINPPLALSVIAAMIITGLISVGLTIWHRHIQMMKNPGTQEDLQETLELGFSFTLWTMLGAFASMAVNPVWGYYISCFSIATSAIGILEDLGSDPYFDVQVRNSTGHMVLGIDYQTGQMTNTSTVGVCGCRTDGAQIVVLSRTAGPFNITAKLDAPEEVNYTLAHWDPIEAKTSESSGTLSPGETTSAILDMIAPTWVTNLIDQNVEFGNSLAYDLDSTDPSGIDTWWINDTNHFSITQTGLITNAIDLAVGTYGLMVNVNDTLGNILTGNFQVFVRDTIAPSWTIAPTDQTLEYGQALDYQLQASDLSGIARWTVTDSVHFAISGSGRLTNITTLDPGVYSFTVAAYDPYDNQVIATISVTVQQPGTPTQPTTPPPPPAIPGFPFAAIFIGLMMSFLLIVVLRRKRKPAKI